MSPALSIFASSWSHLGSTLDVPIKAKLKVYDDVFPVVVIPQISQHGHFEIRYFGTPAYIPRDETGQQSWKVDEIFGVHPVLEKAWSKRDIVSLELAERPRSVAPFQNITVLNIYANVLVVEHNHRGRLSIHKNRILVRDSALKEIEFSLVDFPAFKKPGNILGDILLRGTAEYEAFKRELYTKVGKVLKRGGLVWAGH